MKYDQDKEVITNDAGHVIAREVPLLGYKLVRSQVFHDRLVEALADLLSTEECVCAVAEIKKGTCSVCTYRKLLRRIAKWPMKAGKAALMVLVLGLAMTMSACRKHDDGTPVGMGSTIPGSGSVVMTTYAGAVTVMDQTVCLQSCFQNIPTNADPVDNPADAVRVYLCRNATCSLDALPAKTCAEVWNEPATPCYTSVPSQTIVLGKNYVRFVNAFKTWCVDQACTIPMPGYRSYVIQTTVTQ